MKDNLLDELKNKFEPSKNKKEGFWKVSYTCSVCGEIVSHASEKCPFCHSKMHPEEEVSSIKVEMN